MSKQGEETGPVDGALPDREISYLKLLKSLRAAGEHGATDLGVVRRIATWIDSEQVLHYICLNQRWYDDWEVKEALLRNEQAPREFREELEKQVAIFDLLRELDDPQLTDEEKREIREDVRSLFQTLPERDRQIVKERAYELSSSREDGEPGDRPASPPRLENLGTEEIVMGLHRPRVPPEEDAAGDPSSTEDTGAGAPRPEAEAESVRRVTEIIRTVELDGLWGGAASSELSKDSDAFSDALSASLGPMETMAPDEALREDQVPGGTSRLLEEALKALEPSEDGGSPPVGPVPAEPVPSEPAPAESGSVEAGPDEAGPVEFEAVESASGASGAPAPPQESAGRAPEDPEGPAPQEPIDAAVDSRTLETLDQRQKVQLAGSSGDRNLLAALSYESHEEVHLALIGNSALPEDLGALLARRATNRVAVEIHHNRRLFTRRTVQVAMLNSPNAPSAALLEIVNSVQDLSGLLRIVSSPRVRFLEVKAKARSRLSQMFQNFSEGEQVAAVRRGGRPLLKELWRDFFRRESLVLRCLREKQLDEGSVMEIARSKIAPRRALEQIANTPAWANNYQVTLALVLNPKTPRQVTTRLLRRLTPADRRMVKNNPSLPTFIRQQA